MMKTSIVREQELFLKSKLDALLPFTLTELERDFILSIKVIIGSKKTLAEKIAFKERLFPKGLETADTLCKAAGLLWMAYVCFDDGLDSKTVYDASLFEADLIYRDLVENWKEPAV